MTALPPDPPRLDHVATRQTQLLEAQFRGLLEAAPDAMVIVNPDGRIVLLNRHAETLFGYSRTELLGQPVEILMPMRFREGHPTARAGYFHDPRPRPMGRDLDLYARSKDGKEFPAEISLSPMETEEGTFVTAAIRDVTHRRRLAQELDEQYRRVLEASRLKSEFLANMSHELRTPLNAIIGFTELIVDERLGPVASTQKEYLKDILDNARHLLQLINGVLDLANVESGRMDFHPEAVSVSVLASEAIEMLEGLASRKRIAVTVAIDPAASEVVLDPTKLKQVFYNYLSNALKFTPDEGRVILRALRHDDDHIRIEVEDSGIGIRPDDVGRLFVEFQQLDATAAKKYQGAGLGLALTKRIVEAQGGSVGVRSAPGQGSVFFAVLPRESALAGGTTS
jgi:PAS domain S-box-containing protein